MAFKMNERRMHAARLIAENNLSYDEIASVLHCTRNTLIAWRVQPLFKEAIAEFAKEIERDALRHHIAKKTNRLRDLDDMARRIGLLIQDRESAYTEDSAVVGGRSGLVVKSVKAIGTGRNQQVIETHEFDGALVREWREVYKQAAMESGGIVERHEVSSPDGGPLIIRDIVVDRSASGGSIMDDDDDEPEDMEE